MSGRPIGTTSFTYRSARSGSLVVGLGLAIVVETVALHLVLHARHPWLAWILTTSSLSAIVWLAGDYRALGSGAVRLEGDTLDVSVGRRVSVRLPLSTVQSVVRPTWRDLPAPGDRATGEFLNLTKPAAPNVLVTLVAPATVRIPGGLRRQVRRLAMHLDDPAAFVSALAASPGVERDAAAERA